MTSDGARSATDRAARRAFIRTAHPDLGGDPDRFAEGLAGFDVPGSDRPATPAPARFPVQAVRSRRVDRVLTHTLRELRRRLAGRPPRRLL